MVLYKQETNVRFRFPRVLGWRQQRHADGVLAIARILLFAVEVEHRNNRNHNRKRSCHAFVLLLRGQHATVAQDFMKLTGKATPKLVTKEGAEGRLFQVVAWLTGMKNALKG